MDWEPNHIRPQSRVPAPHWLGCKGFRGMGPAGVVGHQRASGGCRGVRGALGW